MQWARCSWRKICSGPGFVTYWLFVSVFHCIFMIYPWTSNDMSWYSLYLWEAGESGDERKEQKQENGVIDLIWILLSAVRVMMMMWIPVRIWTRPHTYTSAHAEKVTRSNCAHTYVPIFMQQLAECTHSIHAFVQLHKLVNAYTYILVPHAQEIYTHKCTIKWLNEKGLVTLPPRGFRQ